MFWEQGEFDSVVPAKMNLDIMQHEADIPRFFVFLGNAGPYSAALWDH